MLKRRAGGGQAAARELRIHRGREARGRRLRPRFRDNRRARRAGHPAASHRARGPSAATAAARRVVAIGPASPDRTTPRPSAPAGLTLPATPMTADPPRSTEPKGDKAQGVDRPLADVDTGRRAPEGGGHQEHPTVPIRVGPCSTRTLRRAHHLNAEIPIPSTPSGRAAPRRRRPPRPGQPEPRRARPGP